ncbi:hypothetical protein Pcinc_007828 [Petrolisthes cinctipes]|uniref:Uncharacterized protein n=1 Tax=Petrolisthes cinctipes TaxID=88211 RepID=A0AAE1G7S2_PETCI|nr:hypothetical protein Pcinc_007828 [Petrolisthes cinctipes]
MAPLPDPLPRIDVTAVLQTQTDTSNDVINTRQMAWIKDNTLGLDGTGRNIIVANQPPTARLEFFCDCALSETDTVLTAAYYTLFDCSLKQDKLVWHFKWLQLVFLTTFSRVEVSTTTT